MIERKSEYPPVDALLIFLVIICEVVMYLTNPRMVIVVFVVVVILSLLPQKWILWHILGETLLFLPPLIILLSQGFILFGTFVCIMIVIRGIIFGLKWRKMNAERVLCMQKPSVISISSHTTLRSKHMIKPDPMDDPPAA